MPSHIVVGIDGSAESDAALAFAYQEARLRSRPLRVVCVWSASGVAYVGETFAPTADLATSQAYTVKVTSSDNRWYATGLGASATLTSSTD